MSSHPPAKVRPRAASERWLLMVNQHVGEDTQPSASRTLERGEGEGEGEGLTAEPQRSQRSEEDFAFSRVLRRAQPSCANPNPSSLISAISAARRLKIRERSWHAGIEKAGRASDFHSIRGQLFLMVTSYGPKAPSLRRRGTAPRGRGTTAEPQRSQRSEGSFWVCHCAAMHAAANAADRRRRPLRADCVQLGRRLAGLRQDPIRFA